MDTYPGPNVQTVKDSSRYFVVKPIEGPAIGLGFAGLFTFFMEKIKKIVYISSKNSFLFTLLQIVQMPLI